MSGELSCIIMTSAFVIMIVIVVIVSRGLVRGKKKETQNGGKFFVRMVAEDLGLDYEEHKRRIYCTYHGRTVSINFWPIDISGILSLSGGLVMDNAPMDHPGSNQPGIPMRVSGQLKSTQKGYLSLTPAGTVSNLEKIVTRRVKSGYEELDARYSIESSPKDFVTEVFRTPNLRIQIADLMQSNNDSLVVNNTKLILMCQIPLMEMPVIKSRLDFVTMISDAAESYGHQGGK